MKMKVNNEVKELMRKDLLDAIGVFVNEFPNSRKALSQVPTTEELVENPLQLAELVGIAKGIRFSTDCSNSQDDAYGKLVGISLAISMMFVL